MITGSHNPKNYNGIKLVINDKPVSGSEIFDLINQERQLAPKTSHVKIVDIKDRYISEVTENIQVDKKIKVVIDCGNGAAGCVAPLSLIHI